MTAATLTRSKPSGKRLSRGHYVIRWVEAHCVYTQGRWIGKRVRLLPWQKRWVMRAFEIDPESGLRKVRWCLLGLPKKNGKTELAAWLALYFLIGDGEPSPLVACAAGSDEQADLVFGAARRCAELSPTLSQIIDCYEKELTVPSIPGAKLRRLSAAVGTNDGPSWSAVICDELHEWTGPKGEGLWNVLTNGTGAREQPMIVQITTAGYDQETICYREYARGKKIAAGEIDDPAYFFHWEEAPPDTDHRDPRVWRDSNPSFEVIVGEAFYQDQLKRKTENVFRRYFLNQWTSSMEAWLPYGAWGECAEPGPIPDGVDVVLGFDGCLDDQTEVLTEEGWKAFPKLGVHDRVATLGRSGHVEWHRPQRFIGYWHDGPMVRLSGLSVDLLVTPDHDLFLSGRRVKAEEVVRTWPTSRKPRPRWRTRMDAAPARGATPETFTIPPATGLGRGRPLRHLGAVPIESLLRLVGYYIAEGCLWKRGGRAVGVTLSQYRDLQPDVHADMVRCLTEIGLGPCGKDKSVVALSRDLADFLARECGEYSRNKRMPRWVFRLDASLQRVVFDAYMTGDGTVDRNGTRSANTTSPQLADDLQQMALLLGFAATVKPCRSWFHVTFIERRIRPHLHQKPTVKHYSGMVYDLTVPNHVFYVRRNGKPTWTGNSFNNDSTALVACTVQGDDDCPHVDVVAAWERPGGADDTWQVPVLDVEAEIRSACRRWQVAEIVCDPFRWARTYQILEDEGLPIVEFPQSPSRMTPATQRFYEAVVNQQLTHSGDQRLARHLDNCVIKEDSRGVRLAKEKKNSPRKIDLAVAAVMAVERACVLAGADRLPPAEIF